MSVARIVPVVIAVAAAAFVAALAGVGSDWFTGDPPTTNPYASATTTTSTTVAPAATTTIGGQVTTTAPTTTAPAPTTTAAEPKITIAGFSFGPPITVDVGVEVTVENRDSDFHTWTSRTGEFSETLAAGVSIEHVFDEPGVYEFFCQIHPAMQGSITVTP